MSGTTEIINGRVFTWDKGAHGFDTYRIDEVAVSEAEWMHQKIANTPLPARDRTLDPDGNPFDWGDL